MVMIMHSSANLNFLVHFEYRWNSNTSAVLPEPDSSDRVVYVVGILRSANPSTCSPECLHGLLRSHRHVVEVARWPRIGAKQYLAHHPLPRHWQDHFGSNWDRFAARKARFDPLNILAPGQGIFPRNFSPKPGNDAIYHHSSL